MSWSFSRVLVEEFLEDNSLDTVPSAPLSTTPMPPDQYYWPDNKDRGNLSTPAIARRVEIGKQVSLSMCVSSENGRLNPEWVEWLMGWPIGHTDLKPLETAKSHSVELRHGDCLEAVE